MTDSQTRMHITFVHPSFMQLGGAELHIGWMVKDFLQRGHECRIVTAGFHRDVKEFADLEIAGTHIIETGFQEKRNPWSERLQAQRGIGEWLRRNQTSCDVICYVNWPCYWSALDVKSTHSHITKIHLLLEPTLGWVYTPYAKYKWPLLWLLRNRFFTKDRRAMQAMHLTMCHSETMRLYLMKQYQIDAVPTGLGIDTELFQPVTPLPQTLNLQLDSDGIHILTPNKGLATIIPAFQQLRRQHPNVHLHVLGTDCSGDHVHSLPFISSSDMPALFTAMDLMWLHSPHEPWGLMVLESLACGTPLLSHDSGGPSCILDSDSVGWRYDSKQQAIDVLSGIMTKGKSALADMATSCRDLVVKKHRWQQTADTYNQLFQQTRNRNVGNR